MRVDQELSDRVAFLVRNLEGGGVQRMLTILANALARKGTPVDLVTCSEDGELHSQIDERVRIVPLAKSPWLAARLAVISADPWNIYRIFPLLMARNRLSLTTIQCLPSLAAYLREVRPSSIFAATPLLNLEAVLARELAGVASRVVVSERTHFSTSKAKKAPQKRYLGSAMRRHYLRADAIVAVSKGVADDLAETVGIPRERITVLYNPTLTPDFDSRSLEDIDHPWFSVGQPPVILGVGRVSYQKDFSTLLRAFARLRRDRLCRLMIIGRHEQEDRLNVLAEELGIQDDLQLTGFIANPLPYMRKAAIFALSSRFEGFPNVLLEALACGTPVVSTDCPSGPREILVDGVYGELVPVGDDEAMARAIERTLAAPPNRERLAERAREFGYDTAVARYLEVVAPRTRRPDISAAPQERTAHA